MSEVNLDDRLWTAEHVRKYLKTLGIPHTHINSTRNWMQKMKVGKIGMKTSKRLVDAAIERAENAAMDEEEENNA